MSADRTAHPGEPDAGEPDAEEPDAEEPDELALRPGTPGDADALAELATAARRAAVPLMPPPVHTAEEDREWIGRQLAGEREVWVAEVAGRLVGYILLEPGWLHSIYVAPGHTGRGIGTVLLDLAKGLRPEGLALWVFQSNVPARRFYLRHGFAEAERTDGSDNEEGAPDIRMVWPGRIGELRQRIDVIDRRLAELLNERALVTAEIQKRKAIPGHAGRDPERESEIVARMARLAPNLGRERLAEIMHTVISVSLDAADP